MGPELDHVFICVADPAGAERTLAEFGLSFGRHLIHEGQGTQNACAFFDNAYVELLWRRDDDELRSEVVRPVALWERTRWAETGASPFGIAYRPGSGGIAVETWPYGAPFLETPGTIPIVTPPFSWHEPLIFLQPRSRAPATWPADVRPPLEHRGKHHRLTAVTICGPQTGELSPGLHTFQDLRALALKPGAEHCLELEWDDAIAGGFHDFRPALPLVWRW